MVTRKIEPEVKVEAVQEFLDGRSYPSAIANRLGISLASFQMWVKNYKSMGADAFSHNGYKHYSKEFKEQAVKDYLSGVRSLQDICEIHKIPSTSILRKWIKKYNGHDGCSSFSGSFQSYMTIILLYPVAELFC